MRRAAAVEHALYVACLTVLAMLLAGGGWLAIGTAKATILLAGAVLGSLCWGLARGAMRRPSGRLRPWLGGLVFLCFWLAFPLFQPLHPVWPIAGKDAALLVLDRRLWNGRSLPEWLLDVAQPVLSDVLSATYFGFYPLVIGAVGFFCSRRRTPAARAFLAGMALMYLAGFVGYLLVPAAGPFLAFPERFPYPPPGGALTAAVAGVIREGVTGMDVFPSLHLGVSAYIVLALWSVGFRRAALALVPLVLAIGVATVYLRFHYGIDLIAGLALAVVAARLARWLDTRLPHLAADVGNTTSLTN